MIILIDGYNLLKQHFAGRHVDERLVKNFERQLDRYHQKRGHKIVLVFDGGHVPWPEQKEVDGVVVVYVGYRRTADDYIKNYIAENHKSELLLVSSDRELNNWASRHEIASLNSLDFYEIIEDTLRQKKCVRLHEQHIVKTSTGDDDALDELMRQGSKHVCGKDDQASTSIRRRSGAQDDKIEKLLRKKIEKL